MALIEYSPGTIATPSFDPPVTQALQKQGAVEIIFSREIDPATATAPAIRLFDDTIGYEHDTNIEVHTAGGSSRVEVRHPAEFEFDHRVRLVVSGALKYTDGTQAGPFDAYWNVKPGGHPHSLVAPVVKTLMDARVTGATQPWARGWDDSAVTGQRIRGMKNATQYSADWLAGETANAVVGAPADHAAARTAYAQFTEEMSGCIASGWGWFFTGTAAYRDKPGAFIMDWLRKFDITPKYKTDTSNYPWDAILWALCILKLCYAADLIWEEGAAGFDAFDKGELRLRLRAWGKILANDWKADLDGENLNNICAWTNAAVAAIGFLIGDEKMKLWAYDGSDQPNSWTANARPFTYCRDNLFDASGSYVNEATREQRNGAGKGWTYGVYAANAMMWHMHIMANHDWKWEFDTTNIHGNTLEDTLNFYVDFIDGTADWSTRYSGNQISAYDRWYNAQKFFGKGAHYYRTNKLRDVINSSFGVDSSGNNMQEPFGEDQIHWTGGNLDFLPAASAMGADVTAPNNPTGQAAATKGVSWVELTWTRSAITDEADIPRHYEIIDETGAPVTLGTTRSNGYCVTNLAPGTAYTFRIKAVDYAGNKSAGVTVAVTTDSV